MRPGTQHAVARRAPWLGALVLGWSVRARAHDASDELTVGVITSSSRASGAPYVSDRLGGSLDASDDLTLSLDGTFTRYFKANHEPGENIFQFVASADYTPDDHWSFGMDVRGSPPSTAVTRTPEGAVRSRTSLLGAGAFAEYGTAGDGDAETIVEGSIAVTEYATTQRARGSRPSPSSLTQFRVSLGVTEVLWQDTEGSLFGSWYAYSPDPADTGYFGASVFGRESVSEGLPLQPLRWSLRPTLRQRLGPVRVSGYFQYGRYVDDTGWSVLGGAKAQVKLSDAWKLWISVNVQRDADPGGERILIPWAALGARVTF